MGRQMKLICEDLLHVNYLNDLVQTSTNTGSNSHTSSVRASDKATLESF